MWKYPIQTDSSRRCMIWGNRRFCYMCCYIEASFAPIYSTLSNSISAPIYDETCPSVPKWYFLVILLKIPTLNYRFSSASARNHFKLGMVIVRGEIFRLTSKSLNLIICAKSAFSTFLSKKWHFWQKWKIFTSQCSAHPQLSEKPNCMGSPAFIQKDTSKDLFCRQKVKNVKKLVELISISAKHQKTQTKTFNMEC